MSFLKGFLYAFSGIIHCIKNERNMRFHTVAALYVLIFARFFHFSRGEYILLLLTISSVMVLEAVNTAIEELCDKVSPERDEHIRHAKDAGVFCGGDRCRVILEWGRVAGRLTFLRKSSVAYRRLDDIVGAVSAVYRIRSIPFLQNQTTLIDNVQCSMYNVPCTGRKRKGNR